MTGTLTNDEFCELKSSSFDDIDEQINLIYQKSPHQEFPSIFE